MIEVASTRRLGAQDKVDFWNELIGSTYSGMSVDPATTAFNASLSLWQLSELRMVRPVSTAAVVSRSPRSQARYATPQYILHTLTRGSATLHQRGRSVHLTEGDMVICASDETYRFDALTTHEMMVVEMDATALSSRLPNVDDFVARRISASLPGARLLRRFKESLWLEAREKLPAAQWQMHAGVLSDLIVASLDADELDPGTTGDALFKRMQNMIAERLGDFDLGPAELARELGVPLRTLQATTARAGTTVSRVITSLRLQRAAHLLVSQEARSITQIAFECGFSDPSHFARRFTQAFGTSPKKYQRLN